MKPIFDGSQTLCIGASGGRSRQNLMEPVWDLGGLELGGPGCHPQEQKRCRGMSDQFAQRSQRSSPIAFTKTSQGQNVCKRMCLQSVSICFARGSIESDFHEARGRGGFSKDEARHSVSKSLHFLTCVELSLSLMPLAIHELKVSQLSPLIHVPDTLSHSMYSGSIMVRLSLSPVLGSSHKPRHRERVVSSSSLATKAIDQTIQYPKLRQ